MIDQHKNLAQKFLKKGFWLYLFAFIVAPIGYIIKIIVSQELKVEEIGILYGVMSLMTLANSFNDLGMGESLNKFIPKYVVEKKYDKVKTLLAYALGAQIITGGILFCLFYFGASFLGNHYFHESLAIPVIQIFSFFFLGTTFFQVFYTFFGAVQNTFLQKITDFIRMMLILGFTLFMFLGNLGDLKNYSLSWVFGLFGGIFFAIVFFYFKYYRVYLRNISYVFSKEFFKKIFFYALLVFLGAQASTILSQIDMQMIIYMLGTKDAGYYTNYLSLVSIPFMIIGPIFAFLFPVFSELIAKGEHEKIILIKSIFTKNFLSFSLVFSLLFLVFSKIIAFILFGEKFLTSGEILQYSILFISFNFLLQINFNILAAKGKLKQRLYIILTAIVFNTILNYIFIKTLGVAGAALATGFGWVLIYVLSNNILKEYSSKFDWRYFLKNTGVFGMLSLGMFVFIVPFFEGLGRFESLIYLSILSLIYFGIYILLNKSDFQYFLGEIKNSRK